MTVVSTIGLDLAKMVFQAHGADVSGGMVFRKTLRRVKVLDFFRAQPRCLVAMDECGGAHHWARQFAFGTTCGLSRPLSSNRSSNDRRTMHPTLRACTSLIRIATRDRYDKRGRRDELAGDRATPA